METCLLEEKKMTEYSHNLIQCVCLLVECRGKVMGLEPGEHDWKVYLIVLEER